MIIRELKMNLIGFSFEFGFKCVNLKAKTKSNNLKIYVYE